MKVDYCETGLVIYKTAERAIRRVRAQAKRIHSVGLKHAKPFRCSVCHQWHIKPANSEHEHEAA